VDKVRLGLVGCGGMGTRHLHGLKQLADSPFDCIELRAVCDISAENAAMAAAAAEQLLGVRPQVCTNMEAMVQQVPDLEAVDVVTDPSVHHTVVCEALDLGLHVLVEKPLATTREQARALIEAARREGRVLQVGHIERFSQAFRRIEPVLRRPRFIEAHRIGPYPARATDVGVVLDLMIHDLQILHALDPSPVRDVRAVGIDVLSDRVDIADARLELESGCTANLTASRVSADRVRQLRLFFEDRYFSLDYWKQTVRGARRVRSTEEAPAGGSVTAGGPAGRILAADLEVERGEPLRVELEAFLDRCAGGNAPLVDGAAGRWALQTALRVNETIAEGLARR